MRTDLAIELKEKYQQDNVEISGVEIYEECLQKNTKVTRVDIVNENGARAIGRPIGRYITIENKTNMTDEISDIIFNTLNELVDFSYRMNKAPTMLCGTNNTNEYEYRKILVVGLGNREVTPDSLGAKVIDKVYATRHLMNEFGTTGNEVIVISPGVYGQTGMEVGEIVEALVEKFNIETVIAIDALAAGELKRLNKTIQLTNTGICPGAGVGNNRKELSRNTLGVDVIAIGVPTVVDLSTITGNEEFKGMFVTSNNIDEVLLDISRIIAQSINRFLE